jgi:uncharacterized protein (TIGR00725 family)
MPRTASGSALPLRIAVSGAGASDDPELGDATRLAARLGAALARAGAIVVTGGLGGVMEAAARGAHEAGGLTIGILPGPSAIDANPWISVPIVTDLGHARNVILVHTAEAVIAVGGSYGTLSEIALALKIGVPVGTLGSWEMARPGHEKPPIHTFSEPEAAAAWAIAAADEWRRRPGQ